MALCGTILAAAMTAFQVCAACLMEYEPNLQDRCWMFGHDPGQHDRPGNVFNIPPSAGVSQAEACRMMGVSNLMVCIWSQPGEDYLSQFKGLKRVSWAVENGWAKQVMKREIYAKQMPYVENLFKKMPNLVGVDFDDWFYMEPRPESAFETLEDGRREVVAAGPMSERELRQARRRIASWGRPADMRLIVYSRDVPVPGILPVIDVFDTVTFWTWDAADLARLRENFAMYRKLVPEKPTLLGMYMWDFGGKKPIGVDTMRRQLDFALEKFRCGEIDGVIFHCTPLVDKNIPEVEVCRKRIADHGQEHIGRRNPSAAKREPFPIDTSLDLTNDYLHPTAKGYDLCAEALAPIVEAECAALQRPVSRSASTQPTDELQEKAQALADFAVKEGMQGALQFCAFKDGKCIVDVWAGAMTTNAGAAKIDGNTLFPIFSTEKPLLATAVHRSVEQGKLAYDKPVNAYWPEFEGGGKERLTPRLLLAYRSGLPDVKPGMEWDCLSELADWQGMLDWYASCEPEIEPGTKQRYMPRSYGWALGGLLEKAWGRIANDILREQVLVPAGIEHDFYFVCGDDEIGRIATAYRSEVFETMNSDIARRSLLPSAWAVSSARGIAKFYNRLCGFDGKPPLVKKETLDEALKPCRHESDPVPDAEGLKKWHMIFGMGYGLWGEADDISRVFGHGGVGGSEGLCDRSQRLVVGYTCNFENAPPKLREAFYSLVGIRWRYWKDDVNIQDLQMATAVPAADTAAVGSGDAPDVSVASFCERAKKGGRLTVAFLGGSLSWGANATDPNRTSWRAKVGEKLERRYPDAHFKFVDAAIGGTDSQLGIFRLERDVIAYKPDLVFVEWLVNDGTRSAGDNRSCSYEGIIRHLMERLPNCVPVQVLLPVRAAIEEQDAAKLLRWDEQKRIGAAYGLVCADVLGEMRRRYADGKADLDMMWPALIGDNVHPHDFGYGLYAGIIWEKVFANPSPRSPSLAKEWLFAPKYRHVVRENVAEWKNFPKGWHRGFCSMRAETFDFLCSRWQDGLAVAANCAYNPKTRKRELLPDAVVEPLRATFRGEVLFIYGETACQGSRCEVYVDGVRVAERDTGKMFGTVPVHSSAYLDWQVGADFDADREHTLEIRPVFDDGEPQEFRLGSICVAGRNAAWVRPVAASRKNAFGIAPESVVASGDGFTNRLSCTESGWSDGEVSIVINGDGCISVRSPTKGLSSVVVSWKREWPSGALFLNDAWERSYGDIGWQPLSNSEIISPWYFLAAADGKTCGIGVETQPNAMACWKIDKDGFSLVLDVRAGGRPVRLGNRALRACRIVRAESTAGESAWQFGRRFCHMMCPKPRLPKSPVYGYNDWYCAYGKNTATNFLADAEYVMSCARGCENPPYVVMDDGWQKNSPPVVGESGRGPWDAAGPKFGMGMPEFCRAIAALGAKPGLWYRPLRAWDELPEEQRLMADMDYLDPTVPSVRSRIVEDMRRFREWGFKLVKIDFLSYDISQLWPCDSHPFPELFIQDDRAWRDDSRTTAEVMLDLYRAMKNAAGEDVVIIGCNALNHLAAGVFELQRTGNDTSGRDWEWTRKNGVNTLAMRSIQDCAFFKVDADCVGLASEGAVPWTLNRQWMELLGRSGTPMFVSWRRELATPEVRAALADAFKRASSERETAEPIDWFETRQPRRWHFADGTAEYEW